VLVEGLRDQGMAVDSAHDGLTAAAKLDVNAYDVVVLDRDLPGVHGDEVCRQLTAEGFRARILMLTASGGIEERVKGLSLGADDYLPKPFAFAELVARVRALARRAQPALPPVLEHGDLQLDSGRRLATRNGERLDLSAKEFAVLELTVSRLRRKLGEPQLIETVPGGGYRI